MDVEAAVPRRVEDGLRQYQAIRGNDQNLELGVAQRHLDGLIAQRRRLQDVETVRLRVTLDRRWRECKASAGWPIGLRQHDRYRVAGRVNCSEHADGKIRRTGEAYAHRAAPQPARRCFLRNLDVRRARLSGDRYSTKTFPTRWSISC